MKLQNELLKFFLKEWLLIASAVGFVLISIYTQHFPAYSLQEMEILFILFALFISVKGLEHSGLILKLSQSIERGKFISFKLVVTTFILSMLITNDVALIVIVPLTLSLNVNRRDILVILEALAANAGSALTPFGNPQNLFIYWFYNLSPTQFISSIVTFSFVFLCLLVLSSFIIKTKSTLPYPVKAKKIKNSSYIYGLLLIVSLLTVLRILPVLAVLLVIFYALLFDRKSLRVDYSLLLSFFFFFGLAENMKIVLVSEISHSEHVFIFSALASQIISNVPTALLFAKFTVQWKALLWGTNVGGFGSLVGSLANLIAYKFYVTNKSTNNSKSFTLKFLTIGYLAFSVGIALYFILEKL